MNIKITNKHNQLFDILYLDIKKKYDKYIHKHKTLKKYNLVRKHNYFFYINIKIDKREELIKCCYQISGAKGKIKILDNQYYFINDANFNYSTVDFKECVTKSIEVKVLDEFKRTDKSYEIECVDFVNVFSNAKLLIRIIVYRDIEKEIEKLKKINKVI